MGSFIEIHSDQVGDVGFAVEDTYENISKKIQNILDDEDGEGCLVINSNNKEESPCNFILSRHIIETSFIVVFDDEETSKKTTKNKNAKKVIRFKQNDEKE